MCLERSQNLKSRGQDSHNAIITSDEEILGTGAYAAYFVVLEEGFTFVIWRFDLADLEEIERFPLCLLVRLMIDWIIKLTEVKAISTIHRIHNGLKELKCIASVNNKARLPG